MTAAGGAFRKAKVERANEYQSRSLPSISSGEINLGRISPCTSVGEVRCVENWKVAVDNDVYPPPTGRNQSRITRRTGTLSAYIGYVDIFHVESLNQG